MSLLESKILSEASPVDSGVQTSGAISRAAENSDATNEANKMTGGKRRPRKTGKRYRKKSGKKPSKSLRKSRRVRKFSWIKF